MATNGLRFELLIPVLLTGPCLFLLIYLGNAITWPVAALVTLLLAGYVCVCFFWDDSSGEAA